MYYLLYGFLYLISLLPFPILYGISDFAYFIIYRIIGYRKEVVLSNLTIAFPEKTLEEKKIISKKFYKNFTDNFIETIKVLSISKKQMQKRLVGNNDTLNAYLDSGKNIQLYLGHFFNWEFANLSLSLNSKYPVLVVYMPLVNKALERLFTKIRTRYNAKLLAATSYLKEFRKYSTEKYCLVFVGDQSSGKLNSAFWLPFFGKITPFVTGPEKNARLNNTVTLYVNFKKLKRGYYNLNAQLLNDEPRKLQEGELTKLFINCVEENIKAQPEIYLWTHRRWKHTFDPSRHRAL